MARPPAWTRAIEWAANLLRSSLGEGWAVKASGAEYRPPLWSALVSAKSHTLGAAEVLEWALRLHVLTDVRGIAVVRRDLSRDVSAGRALHTQMQLETAAQARRLGWPIRLEPSGGASPGDVELTPPGHARIAVEIKALSEREQSRRERDSISEVTDRLQMVAMSHGLWLAGHLHRMPSEDELVGIERWIGAPDAAQSRRLQALDGIDLYVLPRDAAGGHVLHSPTVRDQLLPRLASTIGKKAEQMKGSGSGWLRLTALTGLWPTTQWGLSSLAEKLPSMAAALHAELGDAVPDGIVLLSAASHANGEPDETVRGDAGIAARRAIAPIRARETLVMPFTDAGRADAEPWLELVDSESDWLDWALGEVGLGSVAEIFAS